jgi:hypothetical protein
MDKTYLYIYNYLGKPFVTEIPMVKAMLDILKINHNNSSDYKKRQWLSIPQKAGISFKMLKSLGMYINLYQFLYHHFYITIFHHYYCI